MDCFSGIEECGLVLSDVQVKVKNVKNEPDVEKTVKFQGVTQLMFLSRPELECQKSNGKYHSKKKQVSPVVPPIYIRNM